MQPDRIWLFLFWEIQDYDISIHRIHSPQLGGHSGRGVVVLKQSSPSSRRIGRRVFSIPAAGRSLIRSLLCFRGNIHKAWNTASLQEEWGIERKYR